MLTADNNMINLRLNTPDALAAYVARQLNNMFPCEGFEADEERLVNVVPSALARMEPILGAVRNFNSRTFDHFHTLQYATFLYLLANQRWTESGGADSLPDRIFGLNRSLNAIDLFYSVNMPEVFFLSHALGAVIGDAQYENGLVIFQGVTIGRVGEARPKLGKQVILYPGAQVTGAAEIGDGCVIGAGARVHGEIIPPMSVVALQSDGRQAVKKRSRDYSALYFRH